MGLRWRRVHEVGVFAIDGVGVAVHSRCQFLHVVHHAVPLGEGDPLVSVDVESAHDSDDLGLGGAPAIHAAEVHDVVVVEEAFASVVNRLEGSRVRPVKSTP